ncbi:glycosyltransferase [Rubripirellula amarantea]|nr:glycosyltransferase [Rubripirellula amarantea]
MTTICHIVESFAYGTAKSVNQLCRFLADDACVQVYYGKRQGTELDLVDCDPRVTWVPLPGIGKTAHLENVSFLARRLRRGVDVVHGHSAYGGMYAKILHRSTSARVVYSPRGYAFLRRDFKALTRQLFCAMERMTADHCLTIGCGRFESTLAHQLGGFALQINNGFSVHDPEPVDRLDNVVVGAGRVCFQKGYDHFLDVARRMPHVSFLWVGDAEDGEPMAKLPVPDNVRRVGYMPHSELLDVIRRSRCVFLPSRWEGLSRFLIESIGYAKAIVTSQFGGNLDCLDGHPDKQDLMRFRNGFAANSVDGWCTAIDEMMSHDTMVDDMQQSSHQLASEHFDIDKIAVQWQRLYHELASGYSLHSMVNCWNAPSDDPRFRWESKESQPQTSPSVSV